LSVKILHTNDFHGTLSGARFEALLDLRRGVDLYLDSGDVIRTGNLGIPLRREPAWDALKELACTASVLGNRETHVLDRAFRAKIAGAEHPLLCSNLFAKDGSQPLPGHLVLERAGLRVGIVGVMVPMVTRRMKSQAASAYLWEPPIGLAAEWAQRLRPEVDLLIALTHIGHRQDLELAHRCGEFDLILGGHSHTVVEQPVLVGRTFVCQGGSHGRFAGIYEWTPPSAEPSAPSPGTSGFGTWGTGKLAGGLVALPA
jgi:2',3'-cyclic-nucleotide 2'-phosphodiesterase (5'-nucleotidase family)